MDFDSGHPSSDTKWILEILPPMALAEDHVNSSPRQPTLPGDHPRSSATVVYNRTVLLENRQSGTDGPPSTFCRRTIFWNKRLCVDVVKFFADWFLRHQELVKKSSAFLVKATYSANFADVLQAYPQLNGFVQIVEMKGQYTHLCQMWKTITEQMEVSAGDPIPVEFADCVSRAGMSPLVYVLLKDAIGKHRHIETACIIAEAPADEISKSTAACASFLIEGLQAELSASQ
ncbi:hypothetical protein PtA15_3A197 [Puccinia triticina]|uniref:Uncharacterized protein n=1 Tax=Puccinia triticina TaxID=208348 RepID=A0ABY7CD38_9BASI|nr:uncharacterized protein PtA15_3A197 [Puccinia triticina]WAQ82833.1 hypothetical protein PtA15_3A197 [Puccinia triticina]